MKDNFKFFIFDNGIQIMAEVGRWDEIVGSAQLKYPFQLTTVSTEKGMSQTLIPFLQYTDDIEMEIRIDKIFTSYIPMDVLVQNYKDAVVKFKASRSPIVQANSNHLKIINEHNGTH